MAILSQIHRARTHKQRLYMLLALSTVPLFGVIAAFGIAPQTLPENTQVVEMTKTLNLPTESSVATNDSSESTKLRQVDQVRRDDTLSSLLMRLNISNPQAIFYLSHSPQARMFSTQLKPGRTITSTTSMDGELLELQFHIEGARSLLIRKTGGGYSTQEINLHLEKRIETKSASIQSSLFAATDASEIPDQIALQLADIFSSEVDFNQDLRVGDHFSVIYESSFINGEQIGSGKVIGAEFFNRDRVFRALLYRTHDGRENYYSPDGKPLQKAFLRSPLEFSRISSGFSLARFHPVLQTWRAHKGVDYAAPIGTRVRAVSEGVVNFAGEQGGYGKVVVLQHNGGVNTVYGHLSRFASGLHRGQKVSQGQNIGFVGMSGLATGPHLHYEFRLHGEHRNPLTVALPSPAPLPADQFKDFQEQTGQSFSQLNFLSARNLASLE